MNKDEKILLNMFWAGRKLQTGRKYFGFFSLLIVMVCLNHKNVTDGWGQDFWIGYWAHISEDTYVMHIVKVLHK